MRRHVPESSNLARATFPISPTPLGCILYGMWASDLKSRVRGLHPETSPDVRDASSYTREGAPSISHLAQHTHSHFSGAKGLPGRKKPAHVYKRRYRMEFLLWHSRLGTWLWRRLQPRIRCSIPGPGISMCRGYSQQINKQITARLFFPQQTQLSAANVAKR